MILIGTHADLASPPLPKTADGDFYSSDADALLGTIQLRFASDFLIGDKVYLLDSHQSTSVGVRALKAYLQQMKIAIVQVRWNF